MKKFVKIMIVSVMFATALCGIYFVLHQPAKAAQINPPCQARPILPLPDWADKANIQGYYAGYRIGRLGDTFEVELELCRDVNDTVTIVTGTLVPGMSIDGLKFTFKPTATGTYYVPFGASIGGKTLDYCTVIFMVRPALEEIFYPIKEAQ